MKKQLEKIPEGRSKAAIVRAPHRAFRPEARAADFKISWLRLNLCRRKTPVFYKRSQGTAFAVFPSS